MGHNLSYFLSLAKGVAGRQCFYPCLSVMGGPMLPLPMMHCTPLYSLYHQPWPCAAVDIKHGTHPLAITKDLFKLVHLSTPPLTHTGTDIIVCTAGKRVVRILLERLLV